jgi:site-specific recombinase XerD
MWASWAFSGGAPEEAGMVDPASVRFVGPLLPYVDGFWSELIRRGYAPLYAQNFLWVAAHMSRWLASRRLEAIDLTVARTTQFSAHRRRQGYTRLLTRRALERLLEYLRRVGAAPPLPVAPAVDTPVDRFAREYSEFLTGQRGLAARTIRWYTDFARRLIDTEFGGEVPDWPCALDAASVTAFISREFARSSIGQSKGVVTRLRSLLRYLHVQGTLQRDLAACVPAVAGWRLADLPKALAPEQLEQLLTVYDSRSLVGARDRAVLYLLARLGLRAGEVAALCLTDIDWRAGEVVVRGKSRRESRLPLPLDVGKVVVKYLRLRPSVATRALFLTVHAPRRPIASGVVSAIARKALRATGITTGSAHVLRHTAATMMLRHGASLAEISHVLRHRHLDTTAIYAKVDFAALRTVVRAWPGEVA